MIACYKYRFESFHKTQTGMSTLQPYTPLISKLRLNRRASYAHQWATFGNLLWIVLVVTIIRLLYVGILNPIELVKDEAHYWEWARHLAGSYYTKGPGIAWLIAASVRIFGQSEWAVRLPSILIASMTALSLAKLTATVSGNDQRAGFFAGIAFLLVPACQVTGMLMTIDGPYMLCWVFAIWSTAIAGKQQDTQRLPWGYILVGFFLGLGFLFKYTMVLLLPGVAVYLWFCRGKRKWGMQTMLCLVIGLLVMLGMSYPVICWNHQHDWPTLSHLLGRLHLPGGDEAVSHQWSATWFFEYLFTQVGIIGPAGIAVMIMSLKLAWRHRKQDAKRWDGQLLMICCSLPILLFYSIIAIFKPTQGNWTLAGYLSLFVIVGMQVTRQMSHYQSQVRRWERLPFPRPKRGYLRSKPETWFQIAWEVHIKWGIGAAVVILSLPLIGHLPGLDRYVPTHRWEGARLQAQRVDHVRRQIAEKQGQLPVLISDHYGDTSQLAFYLPDHPRVFCAGHLLGRRKSAYDFFADQNLKDPELLGRTVLLIHGSEKRWQDLFAFSSFHVIDREHQIYRMDGYAGLKTGSPLP
jgi:undecaprenyl-diphosphatase